MNNGIVQWRDSFPRSVVSSRTFDDFFGDFFKKFDTPEMASVHLFGKDQVVPYDVVQVKNDKGENIGTEISYTLDGYTPEEIEVENDNANESITI